MNKGYLFLIISTLFFSTTGVVVKLIGNSMNTFVITFSRFFIGLIVLGAIGFFFNKKIFKVNSKELFDYLITSFLLVSGLTILFFAFKLSKVSSVILINSSQAIFVLIFSLYFLKEKITRQKLGAIILAFIGLIILNPITFNSEEGIGNFLGLLSGIIMAITIVKMKKEDTQGGLKTTFWIFFFSTIILLPSPFIFGLGEISNNIGYILWLGVICGGIGYFLYNLSLEHIEADIIGILGVILKSIVGIFLSFIILNEQLTTQLALGGIFLLLAAIILNYHYKDPANKLKLG